MEQIVSVIMFVLIIMNKVEQKELILLSIAITKQH